MKNKEELKNLKEEVENESRKPHELTEEDLEQVTGGFASTSKRVFETAFIVATPVREMKAFQYGE